MRVITIIGAGVVGVANAYMLCKAGYQVILIDKNQQAAEGASAGNGAQLSYAYGDAMASPALLTAIPSILLGKDPAFKIKMQFDPEFWLWGLKFLLNTPAMKWKRNTRHILEIAQSSASLIKDLQNEFSLSFDFRESGKMHLYSCMESFSKAKASLALKQEMGLLQCVLTRAEAINLEPGLDDYADNIAAVIYSKHDAVGDPQKFCRSLISNLQSHYGMKTQLGVSAKKILTTKNKITGLILDNNEELQCDGIIIAAGNDISIVNQLINSCSLIWPIQGYSMTISNSTTFPKVSITDVKRKIVFANLGQRIRIAGLADIGSRNVQFNKDRFKDLKETAVASFPCISNMIREGDMISWTGARPATPSSVPVICRGRFKGSYINMGHGMLGWTLALGSAKKIINIINKDFQ